MRDDTRSAREWAETLLRLAAEVEHTLMVQYLYAGMSVSRESTSGVDHREQILDIAVGKMGHLATVQNLLMLIGGPAAATMQRDVVRRASELDPVAFVPDPATRTAIARYVAVERGGAGGVAAAARWRRGAA